MERADPEPIRAGPDAGLDPFAHLAGGAVREREREQRAGVEPTLEQPGDAAGEDARLPGAGAGDDQHGAVPMLDGGELGWVELCQGFTPMRWVDAGLAESSPARLKAPSWPVCPFCGHLRARCGSRTHRVRTILVV